MRSDFEWSIKFGFRMMFSFLMVKQNACYFVKTMASLGLFYKKNIFMFKTTWASHFVFLPFKIQTLKLLVFDRSVSEPPLYKLSYV